MTVSSSPARPDAQPWATGRRRLLLSAGMLVYPAITAATIPTYSTGWAAFVGYAILVVSCACYVAAMLVTRGGSSSVFWTLYAALWVLFVGELWFARVDAFYLGALVVSISVVPLRRWAAPIIAATALAGILLPITVPGWTGGPGWIQAVMIVFTALLWYAFIEIARANQTLVEARAEVARLASEAERNRIARDLHDLVGHSLTAITVKSNLARQLAAAENSPALSEITEVEQLSRQALADVRAAVSGYREVTLAGELARARELLRASGITADIPTAVEPVDGGAGELFGWAVREGVTNVVRHARASHCSISVSADRVTIADDGTAAAATEGNGLTGLRERAAEEDAVVMAGPRDPRGWELSVVLASTRSR